MAADRHSLLCLQVEYTGIDFVAVEDPADQTVLRVYFLVDPGVMEPIWPLPDKAKLRIWAPAGGRTVAEPEIVDLQFAVDGARTYLKVTVDQPGDFSLYRLEIDDPNHVDYHFRAAEFSFKQACPTSLDCKLELEDDSCPEPDDGLSVDPLARDFLSLRRALHDYAEQKHPDWTRQSDADVGVMLIELMAAIGDEFNYVKDRFAREGVLDELSQRRSLRQLVRLLDYELHDGRNPATVLELDVDENVLVDVDVDAGTRVWAHGFGDAPLTFEVGEGMADYRVGTPGTPRQFLVHSSWNTLPVHEPDGAKPELAKGATELFLAAQVGAEAAWSGTSRMVVLHEDPADGSPGRRHLVHLTEVEEVTDVLTLDTVTRIAWDASEALPCPMVLADMTVKANVVPATAGESFEEFFCVRGDGTLGDVVEREGPHDAIADRRPPLFRYSPKFCEALGLAWLGELDDSRPELELQVVDYDVDPDEWNVDRQWSWRRTLLDSGPGDEHFTVEDGTWRRIVAYRKADGSELVHEDWAANAGYTLRFGDGEFGQIPADGTDFRLRYRSGPGSAANVGAGTIVHLTHPVEGGAPDNANLVAVSNPFAVDEGVDPEDMQRAKFLAPDAFRHDALNAVTPGDYERLAETLDWVQRANASFRWTGSWLTIFVAADPKGAFALSREQRAELEDLMDCVRQVGRDVHVLEPDYIDLDLRVSLCLRGGAYAGQVEAAVLAALTGEGGFFAADNFSFATPLRRSALEAAIQRVPGVRAVEEIQLRAREKTGWIVFNTGEFEVGAGQIIRVVNDLRLPEQGTVIVKAREVA